MMVGIPGSGKTTLRTAIFPDAAVVCPDDKIGYTAERPWTPEAAKAAWSKATEELGTLLAGDAPVVVLDATNTSVRARRKYFPVAISAGRQMVAVWCDVPVCACVGRNQERDAFRRVPSFTIQSMAAKLSQEPPSLSEGFHLVVRVREDGVSMVPSAECLCLDEIVGRFSPKGE